MRPSWTVGVVNLLPVPMGQLPENWRATPRHVSLPAAKEAL
jgi:hypothetical protein